MASPNTITAAAQHDTEAAAEDSTATVVYSSQLFRRDSITDLYLPTSPGDRGPAEQAREVFDAAVEFHQKIFPKHGRPAETWALKTSSLHDVIAVLEEAKARYEKKKTSRSKGFAACISWWTQASKRITKYGQVIDTFVSSNPEYAALVWGGLRFLFVVTLNHQKLSTGIALAVSELLEALSDVDILAYRLYPTKHIQQAAVELYAHVLEFCIRATKWFCDVEKSFAKKVLRALKDSWAFEFEDIKTNIEKTIGRLKDLSTVAHQAETRDNHVTVEATSIKVQELSAQTRAMVAKVQDLSDRFDEIHEAVLFFSTAPRQSASTAATLRMNPPMLVPFNRERTLQYLTISFSPKETLKHGLALQKQRRDRGDSFVHPALASCALHKWISKPSSSLIRLKSSFIRRRDARDITLDIITSVKSAKLPVIWYLSSAKTSSDDSLVLVDLFKSLSQQIIDQHLDIYERSQINEQMFDACRTTEDWIQLFLRLLSLVPHVVLVIDAHEKVPVISDVLGQFWAEIIKGRIVSIVKMLFVVYQSRTVSLPPLAYHGTPECTNVDLNKGRTSAAGRALLSHGRARQEKLRRSAIRFARFVEKPRETERQS